MLLPGYVLIWLGRFGSCAVIYISWVVRRQDSRMVVRRLQLVPRGRYSENQ